MQLMASKLNILEKELKTFSNNRSLFIDDNENNKQNINLAQDNQKLKDLLSTQIENSENFRINTEKTLNKIKAEFHNMEEEEGEVKDASGDEREGQGRDSMEVDE